MNADTFFKCLFAGWGICFLALIAWFALDCWRVQKFSKQLNKNTRED